MRQDAGARNDVILDMIVRSYIDTAEPVGSRTISRHFDIGLSPASIRNVMADLEELGFLKQPHTSAGRVPTDQGYRYWVDTLMRPEELEKKEKELIRVELEKARTIEALAERVCKVLSELTGNAVIVYVKNLKRVSFLNQILEEAELFIDGASRMLEQPEFQDLAKMRALLHAFGEKADILQALMRDIKDPAVHVRIGSENDMDDLGEVSLVTKDYYFSRAPIGGVAVVGPTRMKYPRVVAIVEFVADSVSQKMDRF